MTDKTVNAGPSAQNGFELQRNTALYLLLNDYFMKFKDKKYFICLEHHDDFLFCFTNDFQEVENIEAYQSKKKSPSTWKINKELNELITKVLKTGKNLIEDKIPKTKEYKHFLFFSTNQTINLEFKPRKNENKKIISESIKEDNSNVHFLNLAEEIRNKITDGIIDAELHSELENLNFMWIDLTRTAKEQENQLEGKISEIFGNKINNKRAAVETLISLFKKIETTYNQNNKVKLLDITKRVDSTIIEQTLDILTSKSKCFEYWQQQSSNIGKILKIKPFEKQIFEFDFETSFDLFKSNEEAEHQKILIFCRKNYKKLKTFTEEENVLELFDLFKKEHLSKFEPIKLKAIFFAAYFEVTYKSEN